MGPVRVVKDSCTFPNSDEAIKAAPEMSSASSTPKEFAVWPQIQL